jgi:hypothetical protein
VVGRSGHAFALAGHPTVLQIVGALLGRQVLQMSADEVVDRATPDPREPHGRFPVRALSGRLSV